MDLELSSSTLVESFERYKDKPSVPTQATEGEIQIHFDSEVKLLYVAFLLFWNLFFNSVLASKSSQLFRLYYLIVLAVNDLLRTLILPHYSSSLFCIIYQGEKSEEKTPHAVDVDLNFLKYVLESHASQLGGAGPATQLFSQLGIQLPHLPPMNVKPDKDTA